MNQSLSQRNLKHRSILYVIGFLFKVGFCFLFFTFITRTDKIKLSTQAEKSILWELINSIYQCRRRSLQKWFKSLKKSLVFDNVAGIRQNSKKNHQKHASSRDHHRMERYVTKKKTVKKKIDNNNKTWIWIKF